MRKILLLLASLLIGLVTYSQPPANDNCSTATVIDMANLDNGAGACVPLVGEDNTDATPWEVSPGLYFTASCWGGSIDSVVFYQFQPQGVSGSIEVSNGPDAAHVALISFPGAACDGNNLVEWGCSASGGPITFDNGLDPNLTYYLVIGFANQAEGPFDLCVFSPPAAPNDECANAIQITNLDGTPCNTGLDNYYPSSENIIPGCFGAATQTVWYWFTAQGPSIADLHIEGAPDNANVAVVDFSGGAPCDLPNGVILAGGCQANADQANPIVLDNQLVVGNTYYVVVSMDNNATGPFSICLDNPEPAFNDECINAPVFPMSELNDSVECLTSIAGNPLNNDWPSTDIGQTYGCWNAGNTYNVWFQFTAQGPDADIEVTSTFGEDAQIALITFPGGACDPANWFIVDCAVDGSLEIDNQLEPNMTYYVTVGFTNNGVGDYCLNIFNPMPPVNDTMCAAINIPLSGQSPVCETNQTTTYANPEFVPSSFPGNCNISTQNTVWYTIQLSDPNNVGFEVDVSQITMTGEISVVLFENPVCSDPGTFSIFQFYCGSVPADPIEFGPVDETATYYLMIGSSEAGQGEFNVCVSEIPPCFDNNYCEDPTGVSSANDLGVIPTTGADCSGGPQDPFVCTDGCNLFADPEPGCTPQGPTVWYTFTTDGMASIMNLQVTSADFEAPTAQLFLSTDGTCNSLVQIGMTPNLLTCPTGSGGELIANSTDVSASSTYYLAIGGTNTVGGDFEVCVSVLEQASNCVLDAGVVVTNRSFGGPLEGPFFPTEVVTVCLNINSYTSSGNNCQWIQGVVPVFGDGWDPVESFAGGIPGGQPLNTELNGNAIPTGGQSSSGTTWDWFDNALYHHPHCYYNIGDFDGNGSLDMCSSLYQEDCSGPGLNGGTGAPCWNFTGDVLPGGWFAYGIDGLCPGQTGHPSVDWGDGNCCGCTMGPWSFCFDLTVRSYPDCDTDENTRDLTVSFFTFADGETGSWNGGPSICGEDEPVVDKLPGCCVELQEMNDEHPPLCQGGVFSWLLDNPGTDFWKWTVDAPPSIVGWSEGEGPNGTQIIDNLTNNGTTSETVTYNFLGFDGGECPSVIMEVTVEVLADIVVTMTPFTVCSTPTEPYVLVPQIEGGDPSSYMYNWNVGGSDPTLEISNPQTGQQYVVTVSDASGCSGTASVVLDVYTTFPVQIDGPVTEQCAQDGTISLSASADGGIPSYMFNWESPSGGSASGSDVDAQESGQWTVIVTDNEGCVGRDSVNLQFNEAPELSVTPDDVAVCPDNPFPEQILAIVEGGDGPYLFEWTLPEGGFSVSSFILVELAGDYHVSVTDANGCTAELDFTVENAPSPMFDLGGPATVCPEELSLGYEISVPPDPSYLNYEWSTTEETSSITVTEPGAYVVTVTNNGGCIGTSEFVLDIHDVPTLDLPDTLEICAGNFGELDAGPGFDDYQWSTGASGQEILVFNEGLIFVIATDPNGCMVEDDVQIIETDFLNPEILGDSVVCNGTPVDVTATTGFETYEWSNGEETETITVDTGGWYYITVSDGDGCFGVDSVLILDSAPSPGISGEPAICDGESTTLNVGDWADIIWSTGEITPSIVADTAGMYSVTVTDQYGCQTETALEVVVSSNPDPDISGPNSFCLGGMATLDAGSGYATYNWSTSENTQTIEVTDGGTYYLTVTNTAGCIGYDTVTVNELSALAPDIEGETTICNGTPVDLDAGSGFMSYMWSTSDTTQVISATSGGTYTVTVTDVQGCTGTDEVTVGEGAPDPEITGLAEVCAGGTATLTATMGFESYQWTSGETTGSIDVNTSGTIIVTVTDQLGCTGTATFDFTVNPNPNPSISGSTTFCTGGSTQLSAPAGFTGYTWTGGSTGQTLVVNSPGDYTVTVTDSNGCTGNSSVTVIESDELVLNVQDTAICEGETVELLVGNFTTYDWSTLETTPTIEVSSGGTYSVTVTDDTGCTGSADITVTENPQPFATVTASASACNATADGSTIDFASLITDGETDGMWVETSATPSGASGSFPVLDFDGVIPGTYTFEYSTTSAIPPCEDQTYEVTVTIMDCACPSPAISDPSPLCSDDGVLDLEDLLIAGETQTGGVWSMIADPGGSNPATLNGTVFDATNADPGTYEIQYTISGIPDGCPDSDTTEIVVNQPPDAGVAAQPARICLGEDSTIVLSGLIVDGDAGGMWVETSDDPSTGGAFDDAGGTFVTTNQLDGTYTFAYVVSGAVPCEEASTTIEVIIEELPQADAGSDALLTCDVPDVELGGPGSSTGSEFEYIWTTSDGVLTDDDILNTSVSNGGTYTLTVRNTITGCESMDDVFVDVADDLPTDVDFNLEFPQCEGEPPAYFEVLAVTGGTGPYAYVLNDEPPTTDPLFTDLSPGSYTLTVEDVNGCSYETSFAIPEVTGLQGIIEGEMIVDKGDAATFHYVLSKGIADSVLWIVNGSLLCTNCDTLTLIPENESDISLVIFDENGCSITLFTTLQVRITRDVYIPNVFSPNGDGLNDYVTVFSASDIAEINYFQVFTRWGELVFDKSNFNHNMEQLGWDGTVGGNGGEALMPGVYVYHVQVEYTDGLIETLKGDITLIR